MSKVVPDNARKFWNTWLEVALGLALFWLVAFFKVPPLVLAVDLALSMWLLVFLVPELVSVARDKPWWTLSWRMWEWPFLGRVAVAYALGIMGGVTVARSPFWPASVARMTIEGTTVTVPTIVGCIAFVGLTGWLIVHNGEQGRMG